MSHLWDAFFRQAARLGDLPATGGPGAGRGTGAALRPVEQATAATTPPRSPAKVYRALRARLPQGGVEGLAP